jgi:hypothetical protein
MRGMVFNIPQLAQGLVLGDLIDGPEPAEIERNLNPDGTILSYQVGGNSSLDKALARIHTRYVIPSDKEPELAQLLLAYVKSRNGFEAACKRWLVDRDTIALDAEFELLSEQQNIFTIGELAQDYEASNDDLITFLEACKVTGDRKKAPFWQTVEPRVYDTDE